MNIYDIIIMGEKVIVADAQSPFFLSISTFSQEFHLTYYLTRLGA